MDMYWLCFSYCEQDLLCPDATFNIHYIQQGAL